MKTYVAICLLMICALPLAIADNKTDGDPFAEGSKWEGTRIFGKNGTNKQKWNLTISKRTGREFEGVLTIPVSGDGNEFKVDIKGNGTVKGDGPVKFLTQKKGAFQQAFTGKLISGTINGSFTGSDVYGKRLVTNTAKLDQVKK